MQFQNPESALKRAEELIAVDQKQQAIQVLYSVITAKKFRVWQPVLEKIMLKYISLCVEMRKGKMAKDGLHQYKMTTQQANTSSLEVVVKYFLDQAEEGAKQAQSKADKVVLDIDDLEAEESAESLILSSVSGEDSKDRTDREIVTPWLKFLWETYRTVLEILRNNNKLETLYQNTAQRAFTFCLKYQRQTEFRRLSEMLRTHLSNLGKFSHQAQAINLHAPETLQQHLDTRFAQLNAASELELWQESFRSIEDIYGLLVISKIKPKPQTLANYFQKLSQVFWVSDNFLFHAYAFYRFFNISKVNRTLSEEESRSMASAVLLASISVPLADGVEDDIFDFTPQKERNARLAALLSFGNVALNPDRDALIEELVSRNISSLVHPELKDFYTIMEQKFNPLQFVSSLRPKLDFIASQPNLKQYVKPLEKLMFVRLLQQLSQVYEVMKIQDFHKLVDFLKPFETEKLIVDAVRRKQVRVRIDYQTGVLNFKNQNLETDQFKSQLVEFAQNLQQAAHLIGGVNQEEVKQKKKEAFQKIIENVNEEHQRTLARKVYIEKKKELIEKALRIKAQEAEAARKKKALENEELERQRIARISAELAEQRKQKEIEDRKKAEIKAFQSAMIAKGVSKDDLDDTNIDPDQWMAQRMRKHAEQQSELSLKHKKIGKRLDWVERAKRGEERPLLAQFYEKSVEEDLQFHKQQVEVQAKAHREQYDRYLEEKKRMAKMLSDKLRFEEAINKRRQQEFDKLKKERDERVSEKRAKQQAEREAREKVDQEKRAESERQRKAQEEAERKKREEIEKKRQEEEEGRKKLQQTAELQRKREEEVAARARQREEEALKKKDEDIRARDSDRERTKEPPRAWRDDNRRSSPPRGDRFRDEPPRRNSPPRGDRFGRDEPPRRDSDRFGRDEPPRRDDRFGRDDRYGRDEPPRRDDRFGRDEPPRRDGDRYGRDEPPRRDDRFGRDEPPRRDDRFGRDEPRRDDRFGRDEPPRRDSDRFGRDNRDSRDSGRARSPPRRDFGGDRRDNFNRDRSPPRRDRSPPRRDRSPPRNRSPVRRPDNDRRDTGRPDPFGGARPRDEVKRSDAPSARDEPRRAEAKAPEEPRREKEESQEDDDGFQKVTAKRKGGRN